VVVAERELVVTPEERAQRPTTEQILELFRELGEELAKLEQPEDGLEGAPLLMVPGRPEALTIPASVLSTLTFIVRHLSLGDAISLMPVHMQLTTQEAADLLAVSRPFLIKLLDERKIPFTRTGTHRRIKLQDALRYKEQRDRHALDTLSHLAREAQEAGDYFG